MASFMSPGNLTTKGGIGQGLGQQYGQNENLQQQTGAQRGLESGSVLGGYQGLVNGGGYSAPEKASIEQGTLGGVQEGYNSAADAATRRAAVTHNSAGYGSFMGELARNKARDLGQAGLGVQSQFAQEAFQRKMAGLQGLQQMYGVDTSFLNALGQQQEGLLNVGSGVESRRKGVLGNISSGLGIAQQVKNLFHPPTSGGGS